MAMFNLKKSVPYISAILLFLVLSFAYFPEVLQGKKLSQHDIKTFQGGSKEIKDFKEKTGDHSLWTNSMFGGMPSYLISNHTPNNISMYINRAINGFDKLSPVNYLFLAMLGFFIALLFFGVDPWLSIAGALAYSFSVYFLIIIEAGHMSKAATMAYLPPIAASIFFIYKKNELKERILALIVLLLFLSIQLYRNHLQITYYTFIIVFVYAIFHFVNSIQKKTLRKFIIDSILMAGVAIIAVSVNFTNIITTFDYGKDSTRGKSELTIVDDDEQEGMSKEYITAWSYGTIETLNLLIPNVMGGGSYSELSTDSEISKEFDKLGVRNKREILKNMPTYWGDQPVTSGPVYIGAVVIFLFILGLFLVKGHIKWWLLTITILSILLAWGKNFGLLTNFFIDYIPGYDKFRTVSMILVIAEFSMPLLAILAVKNILDKKVNKDDVFKALKWAGGIVGAVIILLLINPGILSFSSENDINTFKMMFGLQEDPQSQQILKSLTNAIQSDRAALFQADALRSLIFIALAAALLWLNAKELLKKNLFIAGLAVLILFDLWGVDKRYLNSDNFISARKLKDPFKETPADLFILKDVDPNFRVLNLTVSTFNDASTSYYHKSIGGYHGAKMKRYQELINYGISNDINALYGIFSTEVDQLQFQSTLMNLSILNMLNTKYFILDPNSMPFINQYSLGNAWFVNKIKEVKNADEEIMALQNFDPEQTAIIDQRFKDQFFKFRKDSAAKIELVSYTPNKLVYKTNSNSDQLAVFSEIYYDKGWNAYLNGELVPHMRANYVLRAMKIPAGQHEIEFKFEPKIWKTGTSVALAGSILFILIIAGGLYYKVRSDKKDE
jgi:hypothetical protein